MKRFPRPTLAVLALAFTIFVASGTGASAQDATPAPGVPSSAPDGDRIAAGWAEINAFDLATVSGYDSMVTDRFSTAGITYYGGPEGARAYVMVLTLDSERPQVRQAWVDASSYLQNLGYKGRIDQAASEEANAAPAPAACDEARRVIVAPVDFAFTTAVTMCAVQDEAIVIAYASGSIDERSGYRASDYLAELAADPVA